ncbi:hypothetical protein Scep_002547 [Stephania cephalantha]|uniref:Uncharacterized protein n=1 Tax=Stephania cephalantha TaxID=152367 RepID=A0AAP0LAF1_9MAGN
MTPLAVRRAEAGRAEPVRGPSSSSLASEHFVFVFFFLGWGWASIPDPELGLTCTGDYTPPSLISNELPWRFVRSRQRIIHQYSPNMPTSVLERAHSCRDSLITLGLGPLSRVGSTTEDWARFPFGMGLALDEAHLRTARVHGDELPLGRGRKLARRYTTLVLEHLISEETEHKIDLFLFDKLGRGGSKVKNLVKNIGKGIGNFSRRLGMVKTRPPNSETECTVEFVAKNTQNGVFTYSDRTLNSLPRVTRCVTNKVTNTHLFVVKSFRFLSRMDSMEFELKAKEAVELKVQVENMKREMKENRGGGGGCGGVEGTGSEYEARDVKRKMEELKSKVEFPSCFSWCNPEDDRSSYANDVVLIASDDHESMMSVTAQKAILELKSKVEFLNCFSLRNLEDDRSSYVNGVVVIASDDLESMMS